MTMYAVLPQSAATNINITTSVHQWLFNQVKTPYDAAVTAQSLPGGYTYDPKTSTWSPDSNGLGVMECQPDDPSLFERVPTIAYCIDDGRSTRASESTGVGDMAVWECISCCVAVAPGVTVGDDNTAEPDHYLRDLIRGYVHNALSRSYTMPILDRSQPSGSTFVQIGNAYIHDARATKNTMKDDAQSSLVINRNRYEWTFTLRYAVVATNG